MAVTVHGNGQRERITVDTEQAAKDLVFQARHDRALEAVSPEAARPVS